MLGLPENDENDENNENNEGSRYTPRIRRNVILEAEMVAFSEALNKVDGQPYSAYSSFDDFDNRPTICV